MRKPACFTLSHCCYDLCGVAFIVHLCTPPYGNSITFLSNPVDLSTAWQRVSARRHVVAAMQHLNRPSQLLTSSVELNLVTLYCQFIARKLSPLTQYSSAASPARLLTCVVTHDYFFVVVCLLLFCIFFGQHYYAFDVQSTFCCMTERLPHILTCCKNNKYKYQQL